jgi:hypothetical protein
MPLPERRPLVRDDMVRCSLVSLSLSAMSVIALVARWAAERRGREDMMMMRLMQKGDCCCVMRDGMCDEVRCVCE